MSEPTSASPAPRIAIKFSSSSSSTSKPPNRPRNQSRPNPPSALGKRQRPSALHHDADSDSDDSATGTHEAVTTYGDDKSESDAKRRDAKRGKSGGANGTFVIGGHKNRDWKAELKAQRGSKNDQSHQAQAHMNGASKETDLADQDKQIKWGLNLAKTMTQGETEASNGAASAGPAPAVTDSRADLESETTLNSRGEDNDAMDALLGKRRNLAKDLVINSAPGDNMSTGPSEQEAYHRRMQEAAEVSTLEEYDSIPDGEFGAAMLRGMGWKGDDRDSKPKEVRRRPHLMGLGSKEDEEIRKGELARKHGHRERRPRLDEYRRNKEKERREREERRGDSYKYERERDRRDQSSEKGYGDRDRDDHRRRERSHRR
ncbi:DExH-box splicing factor binding site-domain-containing protein [Xylariaceae sp. FL0662B]|nr:DExH-box splicing factor binding site-domain-containing protein [Xylariaceae sp. FL0662B]